MAKSTKRRWRYYLGDARIGFWKVQYRTVFYCTRHSTHKSVFTERELMADPNTPRITAREARAIIKRGVK